MIQNTTTQITLELSPYKTRQRAPHRIPIMPLEEGLQMLLEEGVKDPLLRTTSGVGGSQHPAPSRKGRATSGPYFSIRQTRGRGRT